MPFTSNSPNHFLASLSADDRKLIAPHLKPLHLPHGAIFYKAEGTIERVYFPHAGIVSLIVGVSSGQFVEAGVLGRNGVIGAGAALDGQVAFNTAISQAEGAGTVIDASVLKRLARESEAIRIALVRQEHVLAAQTQQVAACNALHELEERLSRWLLQSRDLLSSDTLPLTQEFLAHAAQQRHPRRPQAAASRLDQLSPWSHPRARCRRAAGQLLRMLRRDQRAFQPDDRLAAGSRSAERQGRQTLN